MFKSNRELSRKIIDRIPQTMYLRSGITVKVRNRHHINDFWHIFTSAEYMSLIPILNQIKFDNVHLLDLGGGIALFSLLIEHLCRINVLDWHKRTYTIVEASKPNYKMIELNLTKNFAHESFELIYGAAGKKTGIARLIQSSGAPWGNTLAKSDDESTGDKIPYVDLTNYLSRKSTFVKMDIEGAEFEFIPEYLACLSQITGLIIEWHLEKGDVTMAEALLSEAGLRKVKRSWDNGNRVVDLYLR